MCLRIKLHILSVLFLAHLVFLVVVIVECLKELVDLVELHALASVLLLVRLVLKVVSNCLFVQEHELLLGDSLIHIKQLFSSLTIDDLCNYGLIFITEHHLFSCVDVSILRLAIVQVLQHNEELVHLTHLEIAVPRIAVVNVEHNTQILHSLLVRLVQIHLQVFLENAESDTEKHDEKDAVLAVNLIGRQHYVWEVGHHKKRQHVEGCVRDVWHPERALQRALEHRVTDPGEVHDV
jgi:hypothetical protein